MKHRLTEAAISRGMPRRALFRGLPAAGVAAMLPRELSATPALHARADVIVVGAGLAGLAAARRLVERGPSVLVLEARDRVGGRTWSRDIDGAWLDIGGQWVGPGQDRILELAREFGVELFETYQEGDAQLFFRGREDRFSGVPPLPPADLQEIAETISKIDELAKTVPADAPQRAPRAAQWDSQTAETWLEANVKGDGAKFYLSFLIETIYAAEARDLSFLHMLFYVSSADGSFVNLASIEDGAQESRLVGGTQQISIRLAEELGGRVRLNSPVRRISSHARGVVVHTDDGTFWGKRVIVAIPPTLAGRIIYDPPLPPGRDQLTQRFPMGSVIKCQAVYPQPFWRAKGLSGIVVSDLDPVHATFDNSPPSGTPGILLGFLEGQEARRWAGRPAAERRQAVLEAFVRYFGPEASSPVRYREGNWASEEWSRGCYGGYLPPGVWTDFGTAVRAPVGRIHWAGTETATVWNGYMDGAVRSGERAAAEVLSLLG